MALEVEAETTHSRDAGPCRSTTWLPRRSVVDAGLYSRTRSSPRVAWVLTICPSGISASGTAVTARPGGTISCARPSTSSGGALDFAARVFLRSC